MSYNLENNNNEKYYYNGLFTDLCGMSVEDYINSTKLAITIVNGSGGSGNGSIILPGGGNNTGGGNGNTGGDITSPDIPTPSKQTNTLVFSVDTDGYLCVALTYAPKTMITITFSCEDYNGDVKLTSNNVSYTTAFKPKNSQLSISNLKMTPLEDSNYKYGSYKLENPTQMKSYVVYYDMLKKTNENVITNDLVTNFNKITATTNEETMMFVLPGASEDVNNLPDDEYDLWEENNTYEKALVVPSEIYTDKNNKLFSFMLNDADAFIGFENVKTINIDNVDYVVLVDKDDELINSSMEDILAGTYKFKLL
jgi:hypothetical protein